MPAADAEITAAAEKRSCSQGSFSIAGRNKPCPCHSGTTHKMNNADYYAVLNFAPHGPDAQRLVAPGARYLSSTR